MTMTTDYTSRSREAPLPFPRPSLPNAVKRSKDAIKGKQELAALKMYVKQAAAKKQQDQDQQQEVQCNRCEETVATEPDRAPSHLKERATRTVQRHQSLPTAKASKPTRRKSPQEHLDEILQARGYSTERYETLECAYYGKPSSLQIASYDAYIVDLVRKSDVDGLRKLLSAGISPNPCNKMGESLVHMVCRRADAKLLGALVDFGCDLQVADEYGRTPLHDACWATTPSFEVVEIILAADPRLLYMTDCRGAVPLSYIRKDHWDDWIAFLESRLDELWPVRNVAREGKQEAPHLATQQPGSRTYMKPINALTPELAALVASGKMGPNEAQFMLNHGCPESVSDEDTSDDEEEDIIYTDDLSTCVSVMTFDELEMANILENLRGRVSKPLAWSR